MRLIHGAEIPGVSRKRRTVATTIRAPERTSAGDLVKRSFTAVGPSMLRVADITSIPTAAGFVFLAVVLNAGSRRVVGWAFSHGLKTQVALDALDTVLTALGHNDDTHNRDKGSQNTSWAFGNHCRAAGVRPSTGTAGDALDNAMCESFFATLECELDERHRFVTKAEAQIAVFRFIEDLNNPPAPTLVHWIYVTRRIRNRPSIQP